MAEFRRPQTAQEAVLAELRRRIQSGELIPGSPLRQDELAAELGVSRVPLREALRMLEAEGQVSYTAHRGYRVADLHIDDLAEIYHLRGLLEDDLARRSVRTGSTALVEAVRQAHGRLAAVESADAPDPAALAAANRAFHWAILRPGPRAERILAMLWDASDAYRARWFADPGNVARGAGEHAEVMAAVAAGEAESVVRLLAAHRTGAVEALREALGR
jgi:DNA-binding GntR family transcriptional regulator